MSWEKILKNDVLLKEPKYGDAAFYIIYDPRKISYREAAKTATGHYHSRSEARMDLFIEVKDATGFTDLTAKDILDAIENQYGDKLKEGWRDNLGKLEVRQIIERLSSDANIYYYQTGNWEDKIKDNLWEIALRQGHWIGGTASLVPIPYDYFHYNMAMDNTSISLIQDRYGDWREIIRALNTKMSQLAKKLGKIGEHTDGSIAWMEHAQEFIDEIKGE